MNRVLVTGGTGFIGSHLVGRLLADGYQVRVLDSVDAGTRGCRWEHDECEFIEGDVRNKDLVRKLTRGVDLIFHLAALGSVSRSFQTPEETLSVNVVGTSVVLEAAARNQVQRLIFSSSSSVYGDTARLPKRESMRARPKSPYAFSKLFGEQLCRHYADREVNGVDTVCLRYFNVFGPGQDPDSEYAAVIPRFILSAINHEPPMIEGDGEQSRDFTPVAAVVRANMLCAQYIGKLRGQVFNIALGRELSINSLWRLVARQVADPPEPRQAPPRQGDVLRSRASIAKARKHLGYEPFEDLEQAIQETFRFYQESRSHEAPRARVT